MDVSDRIRQIRDLKKIRQTDVAESLGMDNSQYAKLEKRGNKISLQQVERIANALEVSVAELLGIINPEPVDKSRDLEIIIKENNDLKEKVKDLGRLKGHNELLTEKIGLYREILALMKNTEIGIPIYNLILHLIDLKPKITGKYELLNFYVDGMANNESQVKTLSNEIINDFESSIKFVIREQELMGKANVIALMQRIIYSEELLMPEYDKRELSLLRKEFENFIASNPFKDKG